MWMLPLYLQVNQKSDYDYGDMTTAQQRLRSTCSSAQSDQSSLSAWQFSELLTKTDQTAGMCTLTGVFAG